MEATNISILGILFLLFLQSQEYVCESPPMLPMDFSHYKSPESLEWNPGDIIACFINGVAKHILLGSYDGKVIHAPGAGGSKTGNTFIKEEPFLAVTSKKYDTCFLLTLQTDCEFWQRKCRRPYDTSQIFQRARMSVQEYGVNTAGYALYSCNCEHWVTFWRYGEGYSFQVDILGSISPTCPAKGTIWKCPRKKWYERWFPGLFNKLCTVT